jgi:hypothetical protein
MSQRNKEYSKKLKAIRGFVDFNYDLRKPLKSAQKAKINRYHAAIHEIQARANRIYRSKDIKRVRTAQRFGRNEFESLPGIKVAFLESNDANPITRVQFKNGKLAVHRKYFKQEFLEFDQRKLAEDTDAEIQRALDSAKAAFTYRIAAGKFSIERPRTREQLPAEIKKLMNRYGLDPSLRKHKKESDALNHFYPNWLSGLIPLYLKNQNDLKTFRLKEQAIRKRIKKRRKAQKEKSRRGKEKDSGM